MRPYDGKRLTIYLSLRGWFKNRCRCRNRYRDRFDFCVLRKSLINDYDNDSDNG